MDDKKCRPDRPTEPPDQRMGTRRQGGKSRVQSESWEVKDDDEGVEAHRKSVVTQEPKVTSVKEVDEAGVADESTNMKVPRAIAEEAHRDVQVRGECAEMQ